MTKYFLVQDSDIGENESDHPVDFLWLKPYQNGKKNDELLDIIGRGYVNEELQETWFIESLADYYNLDHSKSPTREAGTTSCD